MPAHLDVASLAPLKDTFASAGRLAGLELNPRKSKAIPSAAAAPPEIEEGYQAKLGAVEPARSSMLVCGCGEDLGIFVGPSADRKVNQE